LLFDPEYLLSKEGGILKTNIFVPSFFLARKDQLIRIDRPMIIGRSKGDIILEDDEMLSSAHCEIRPQLLQAFIKDLNSRNGVFVNKEKIKPGVEVQLRAGDAIQIGSHEYIFYDKEEEAKETQPKENRRKHPRPKNLYGYENLFTFYASPYLFRGIYLFLILGTAASFLLNIHLNMPVPEKLSFLESLYKEEIVFAGIKLVFLVWMASLVHGFLMTIYFNRNPVRKGISFAAYCVVIAFMVDFQYGPLGSIKRYLIDRKNLEGLDVSDKAIVNLKNIVDHKEALAKSYEKSKRKIRDEQFALLDKDYKDVINRLDQKIARLNKNKQANR